MKAIFQFPIIRDAVKTGDFIEDVTRHFPKIRCGNAEDSFWENLLGGIAENSPFLAGLIHRHGEVIATIRHNGLETAWADVMQPLLLEDPTDDTAIMQHLRWRKAKAALLIAIADCGGFWELEQVTQAWSDFAILAVNAAINHIIRDIARYGVNPVASKSGWICLAMGKLGASELNYSSDIDLTLFYDETRCGVESDNAAKIFARMAKRLCMILQNPTEDGYVFRTDLRLRPDPAATPPVVSLAAAESYYTALGQNWERAAMIKSRPIAGDIAAAEQFLHQIIRPFVWRRSLDYAALRDIQSVKRQIHAHHGGDIIGRLGHDVKLGQGGIREIEFFAQTQQLIWGGRIPALRVAGTLPALAALCAAGLITAEAEEDLRHAYRFLRRVEHRIQMRDDAQTHKIPATEEEFSRLAAFLGYPHADDFASDLNTHLGNVARHYAGLFALQPSLAGAGGLVFTGVEDDAATLETLRSYGFQNPSLVASCVRAWHYGRIRATRSQSAREILTEITPALLQEFAHYTRPDAGFAAFADFIAALPAGVAFFSLLQRHERLMPVLVRVFCIAPSLAETIRLNPQVLEILLHTPHLTQLPDAETLRHEVSALLAGHDSETAMEILRRWASEKRFLAGVLLVTGQMTASMTGGFLSNVAEIALWVLADTVMADFTRRNGIAQPGKYAILAYGRLAAREMLCDSDLDLVLLYDSTDADATIFYQRFTRRLIASCTTHTREGQLYPVDMRLRPSGASGPVAIHIDGFEIYQQTQAWTWEHLALCRARPVAGDEALCHRIAGFIADIITSPHEAALVQHDVAEMRLKLRQHAPDSGIWQMKHPPGGYLDALLYHQMCQILQMPPPQGLAEHLATCTRAMAIQRLCGTPENMTTCDKAVLECWLLALGCNSLAEAETFLQQTLRFWDENFTRFLAIR